MRRALALAVLALVAGCGGSDVAYTEVESSPAPLPLPKDQGTVAGVTGPSGPTGARCGGGNLGIATFLRVR